MPEPAAIDYKTHILIGVRANGVMKVIAEWPHLPRQIEVQNKIDTAGDAYASRLCADAGGLRPAPAGNDQFSCLGQRS